MAPIGASGIIVTWPEPSENTNCEVGQTLLEQSAGPVNGSFLPIGTTIIEYTYTACNESTECNFEIIVNGQDAVLEFSCPDNIFVTAPIGSSSVEVNWNQPNASTDCPLGEANFTQIEGLENGTEFPIGTTTITYQAIDPCDNQSNCSFDVIVVAEELTAEFICPEDLTFVVPNGTTSLVVNWPEPEGTTNCQLGSSSITQIDGPENGSALPVGITTVMYQYDTGCETMLSCSFNISVILDSTITSTTIIESLAQKIKLFPNPTNQILNIDLRDISEEVGNILIYNPLWQKMTHHLEDVEGVSGLQTVDLKHLTNGVYFIVFQMKNNKNISKQFIIQH